MSRRKQRYSANVANAASPHPYSVLQTAVSCDFCENFVKRVYIWPVEDTGFTDEQIKLLGLKPLSKQFWLCSSCDADEWARVTEESVPQGQQVATLVPAPPITPVTTAVVPPKYTPLCNANFHWETINGPKGYGYILASSLRGGWQMDTSADYALFFDSGWRAITEEETSRYSPGGKPDVPEFKGAETVDRSQWPAAAFIDWSDGKAPTEEGIHAAAWAAQQWAAGKNIQIGCHGAHGRTGTFLAMVLMKAGLAKDAGDAVTQVRENFICKKAVETAVQIDFLLKYGEVLGLPAPVEMPKASGSTWTPPKTAGGGSPLWQQQTDWSAYYGDF